MSNSEMHRPYWKIVDNRHAGFGPTRMMTFEREVPRRTSNSGSCNTEQSSIIIYAVHSY